MYGSNTFRIVFKQQIQVAKNTIDLRINENRQCLFLILSRCFIISRMLLQLLFETVYCL